MAIINVYISKHISTCVYLCNYVHPSLTGRSQISANCQLHYSVETNVFPQNCLRVKGAKLFLCLYWQKSHPTYKHQ